MIQNIYTQQTGKEERLIDTIRGFYGDQKGGCVVIYIDYLDGELLHIHTAA